MVFLAGFLVGKRIFGRADCWGQGNTGCLVECDGVLGVLGNIKRKNKR